MYTFRRDDCRLAFLIIVLKRNKLAIITFSQFDDEWVSDHKDDCEHLLPVVYIRIWLRSKVDKSVGACGTWTSTVLYISSHSSCLFSEKKSRINNNILNPKDWPMMHWKSEQWTQQQKTRFLCFARKNWIFKAKSASFSLGVKWKLFNFPTILEEKGKGSSFNSAKKSFHVINFYQNWSANCKERKASSRNLFMKLTLNFSCLYTCNLLYVPT